MLMVNERERGVADVLPPWRPAAGYKERSSMTQQTVLVPLDGSPLAEGVLPYAETLARLLGATVRLVFVVEPVSESRWERLDDVEQRLDELRRSEAGRYLESIVQQLAQRGSTASICVLAGEAADCIIDAAEDPNVALVAMATHGRGGVKRLFLGSVADKVMRLGTWPTLLVRTTEEQGVQQPLVLRRLLVPLDGSPRAEQALPLAEKLARAAGATLVLARVEREFWQTVMAEAPMYDVTAMDAGVTEALAQYLEKLRCRFPPETALELMPMRGYPALVLEDLALHGGSDLVVMATHGRGGVRRLAIGSMADRLVRLGAPTLLVRTLAERPA
jgi:nucleotide-binding universal stress UspA family protein